MFKTFTEEESYSVVRITDCTPYYEAQLVTNREFLAEILNSSKLCPRIPD